MGHPSNLDLLVDAGAAGYYQIAPKQFSVEAYHKLAELGLLSEDDRVELLEGVISPKMVHSPIHDAIVSVIEQILRPVIDDNWFLRIQSSLTLLRSEPEPDLAVVVGPPLRYMQHHPGGQDVALAIEVAETSLLRDRHKAASYAGANIPAYWIANIEQRRLEVYQHPRGEEYTKRLLLGADDHVELSGGFVAGTFLRVADLIPELPTATA